MKRIKQEPGGSRVPEERELAYYIHDRVDLMHQVFSLLRSRELRAMGPECVHNLGKEDLMELCLEELLGISSKRLCAILDGADPPTDTSSSESDGERMETVSLDSISSDELQQKDDKKKHKCKRKEEKSNKKSTKSATEKSKSAKKYSKGGRDANKSSEKHTDKIEDEPLVVGETRAAERAGMTVLELLELQARARAIRAQLALEHSKKATSAGDHNAAPPSEKVDLHSDSDDSVEIKEEPAQVVELLSSEEEDKKPDVASVFAGTTVPNEAVQINQPKVTKKNDLTIIVPATQTHRKVKLNRRKSSLQQTALAINGPIVQGCAIQDTQKQDTPPSENLDANITVKITSLNTTEIKQNKKDEGKYVALREIKNKEKKRRVKKIKKTAFRETNDGSDHDEITLQLSDSEKMDLLEDLDRKNYDNVTSSDDSSEESSEEESRDNDFKKGENLIETNIHGLDNNDGFTKENKTKYKVHKNKNIPVVPTDVENTENDNSHQNVEHNSKIIQCSNNIVDNLQKQGDLEIGVNTISERSIDKMTLVESALTNKEKTITITSIQDLPTCEDIVESNLMFKENKEKVNNCEEHTPNYKESHENCIKNSTLYESCSEDKDIKQNDENCEAKSNKEQENTILSENKEIYPKRLPSDEHSEIYILDTNENTENTILSKDVIEESSEENMANITENTENIIISKDVLEENMVDTNENTENIRVSTDVLEQSTEEKDKSEGELSDRASSEVEMLEPTEEIVCISDEETPSKKKKKEKKKKEKKSKKEKKKNFRERGDQNFNDESSDSCTEVTLKKGAKTSSSNPPNIKDQIRQISEDLGKADSHPDSNQNSDSEEIYEICEISDGDDSCYEVGGVNISKEPTCEEIEALSAKIDTEIEREDIITEDQIRHLENKDTHEEKQEGEQKEENLEDISWKHRYLDSSKVKKVLKTSNILNAMRKKNIELKKKLAESKKPQDVEKHQKPDFPEEKIEEGSIEHFNTLQAFTKYVDPIKYVTEENNSSENAIQQTVTNTSDGTKGEERTVNEEERKELNVEMKNDAKQLLKMYKRLLKYNNLEKPSDPAKVKKKKNKKQKKNKHLH